jgi:hypothetical protein
MASRRADKLYDWLAELPSPDAELILAAALERAEPPYFDRIVELLFERASDAAWAGLIANYPVLSPEVRARLRADPQQMRSGLVRVLRGGSPQGRCNALQALCENPEPALAYLLPDALRASASDVRRAAAVTLRRLAEIVIEPAAEPARVGPEQSNASQPQSQAPPPASEDRLAVARAVWEALRSFDLHYRLEVVEAALWFTLDFGRDLWEMLGNRRSPTAHVVSANLRSWDSPRLARFLLEALAQSAWRASARDLLVRWRGVPRLTAILRHSDLLRRAEFREGLGSLKRPAWFAGVQDLRELPAELRVQAPDWLVLLSFRPEEKLTLLANWSESAFADLRNAAKKAATSLAAAQNDPRSLETEVQSLPAASRRSGEHTRFTQAEAKPQPVQPPSAPPHAAPPALEQRVATLREQAQRTLQRLAQRGPDRTAANEIAELEEALARLRAELPPEENTPTEWETM